MKMRKSLATSRRRFGTRRSRTGGRRRAPARARLGTMERAQWHKQVLDAYNKLQHDDAPPPLVLPEHEHGDDVEEDDATIRRLYTLAYYGNMATPDVTRAAASRQRRAEAAALGLTTMTASRAPAGRSRTRPSSVRAGSTSARPMRAFETERRRLPRHRLGSRGDAFESIRATRTSSTSPARWGGVWKTYNFSATQPTWLPITDTVGGLAVGAFELDPNNPDTLYLGLGDSLDSSVAGGAMYKSTDGGGTWTMMTARL